MNRRNFLKLFGIGLVPVSLLSARAQAEEYVADIRHIRIKTKFENKHRVTIDNSAEPALADFDRDFGETWEDWVKWNYRDMNNNFYVPPYSQMFEVSEKSVITVTSPAGVTVTFSPVRDGVLRHFMQQVEIDYVNLTLTAIQQPHRLS